MSEQKHRDQARADVAARTVIPVIEEQLVVGKREVEIGTVQLRKTVREHEERVEIPLMKEVAIVERVPRNEYVSVAPPVRTEGDTLVIPVVEEVVEVLKRLVLKEEVHVRRERRETRESHTATVRAEEVRVERGPAREGSV